jgi:hypothetical protein
MTLSHGQQAEFEFSSKTAKSGSAQTSRKKDTRKQIKEGQPEKKRTRRKRRAEAARPEIAQKTRKQKEKKREAVITFPVRLSASEHAQWKDFASKNRFPLHQFIKNSVGDLIARIKHGKLIPWLKIG